MKTFLMRWQRGKRVRQMRAEDKAEKLQSRMTEDGPRQAELTGAAMAPGCWGLSALLTPAEQELPPGLLLTLPLGLETHPCSQSSVGPALPAGDVQGSAHQARGLCQWVLCEHLEACRDTSCSVQLSRNRSKSPQLTLGVATLAEEPKANIPLVPWARSRQGRALGIPREPPHLPALCLCVPQFISLAQLLTSTRVRWRHQLP